MKALVKMCIYKKESYRGEVSEKQHQYLKMVIVKSHKIKRKKAS